MKILAVSDTHRDFNVLKKIVDANRDADMLIHLGDGESEFDSISRLYPQLPMVYVGGNCDFGTHRLYHIVSVCGIRIFCCHGHTYRVRDGLDYLVCAARENECAAALYGHTHIFRKDVLGGVYVMNPGSPSSPRGGNKPTYGIIELDGSDGIKMDIISVEDNKAL